VSVLDRLASALGRNDEVPNQALARELAVSGDKKGLAELAQALTTGTAAVQSDAVKVLYELAEFKPQLVAPHTTVFLELIAGRNNRLIWGGMTALGFVTPLRAELVGAQVERVMEATRKGSVITQDWGIRVLAALAVKRPQEAAKVTRFFTEFLGQCPAKDMPKHAESVLPAATRTNKGVLLATLKRRTPELTATQAKRLAKSVRALDAL